MYSYEWEPKAVEIEHDGKKETIEPLFKGSITVRAPKYLERIGYLKEANLEVNSNELSTSDQADRAEKMVEIAKKHILSVNLKRIEDDFILDDVEDLEVDADAATLLIQVASSVIEGVRLGKHLKKELNGK